MDLLVKLLLKAIIGWIHAHPGSPLSLFMLKERGPRTDVTRMSRPQRLARALAFLIWGCFFLGLWLVTAYLTFGAGLFSPDNVVMMILLFGLALLAGCGFLGGLYLLLGVFV